jgi:hypothetical protein
LPHEEGGREVKKWNNERKKDNEESGERQGYLNKEKKCLGALGWVFTTSDIMRTLTRARSNKFSICAKIGRRWNEKCNIWFGTFLGLMLQAHISTPPPRKCLQM